MNCASCGRTNPTDARFCGGCGTSLAPRCPACGAESQADARFCVGCGAALLAYPAAEVAVARKVVTIVFADLIGSVSLHERLDAESARRLMDRYHRAMSAAIDVHGGRVVQLLGDGVLAAFGVPRVAEDDAIRAVRAAVGMQRAFRELARDQGAAMEGVGLRVAVNTGEIVVGDDENSVMGDPTNVAARLQQEARDGDVIVGEGTQRLVGALVTLAPLGSFALRGRAESVAAYRVVSLDRPASQQSIAFVGRDAELRRLTEVYDAAVAMPGARLAVLLGSPGLGKSRLVAEFTRRAGERATVLSARCDAAGGATFAPLAEALRALLRIDEGAGGDVLRAAIDAVVSGDDAERTRIATGIGALLAGTPAPPEETFFVVRRLLAALAGVRPVVLVIDDLQWAESLLLDLVEHLVQWSTGAPLLVLVAARPELRDTRSSLATPGGVVSEVVTLTGLDAGAATRLAANVIGGSELPAALAGRVLATSEGNPLFVAELVRMLVQDGTLVREGERWITTVEIAKLDMPATIQVLLAARIERLRPEERSVLERAAVIGRQFSRAAVAHLLPRGTSDLDARLEALRRSELIEPDTGWFLGEPALRFHHVLIRDAAYRRVLKETRAELHERFADWIVSRVGEAVEHDETIGWHFEQAHENLRELGPLDARGTSLGERAARHLGAAGRRALARDDLALAAGLLGRALDRLAADDPARADLALEWCEALLAAGDVGPAAVAIEELARLGADSARLRAWRTCFAGQLAALTDPQSLRTTADAVASAAEALAAAGDAAGEAKAHSVRAAALARLGEVGACETALDLALAAARRARDRRRANAVLAGAPVAALWGPSPVTRASGRCLDVVRVLRITQGAPAVEAVALRCQAVLETLRGRGEAARRMIASSRRMVEELGIAQQLLESDVFAGMIELLEGDAEAAEQCLRAAYEGLRERGLGIDAARAAALLGRALLAQGRAAEAETLSHESEALAGDDLKAAIAWRGVRAEALALRGDPTTAVELARAAVAIAAATDALLDHADARSALATALRAAGRSAEADAEATRALDLWEAKGATLLVERSQHGATQVGPAALAGATGTPPSRAVARRVGSNAATEYAARFEAAFRSRDRVALSAAIGDEVKVVHHPTGASFGHEHALGRFEALLRAENPMIEHEPIATLGDALALFRQFTSVDALADDDIAPAGASRTDVVEVIEAGDGRPPRVEIFAENHLADAIARLYERFAELQPEGAARDAAAATARTVAATSGIASTGDLSEVMAEDVTFVDHRLLGFGTLRGVAALGAGERQIRDFTDDRAMRTEEIYALQSDCLLVRVTTSGTDRRSGGRYERPLLDLQIFGADGRVHRREWFDIDREAEALARFDELTGMRPVTARPASRSVRPNAATRGAARLQAAIAARDEAAMQRELAEDYESLHHPTGVLHGRDAPLAAWRELMQARGGVITFEPLATLGEALALIRGVISHAGVQTGDLDVGPVRSEELVLVAVNPRGEAQWAEIFAEDHLADAIARLYERYTELQPEGPEHTRAMNTARATRGLFAGEPALITAAPDHEFQDHRLMGLHGGHVSEAKLERWRRALDELAEDVSVRVDEILRLAPDAWLVRTALAGRDRTSGGRFEQVKLDLRHFDALGRMERSEWFDADCEADALARFDELTGARAPATVAPRRRVPPNAAVACGDLVRAAARARDLDAIAALLADELQVVDNRSGLVIDRAGGLARWRLLFETEGLTVTSETLATLGDSLALGRDCTSFDRLADADLAFGASETRTLIVFESNARGQCARIDVFPETRLADAIARLYERYAEVLPDGSERIRAASTSRTVAALLRDDVEAYEAMLAEDVEFLDRRVMGFEFVRGADAVRRGGRALRELADDLSLRVDGVLALRPDGFVVRTMLAGRDRNTGGRFEHEKLELRCFDVEGRMARVEWFGVEAGAQALARFDELAAEAPEPRFVNAAWRAAKDHEKRLMERDWDAIAASRSPAFRQDDHRAIVGGSLEGEDVLVNQRMIFDGRSLRIDSAMLATRGERLVLRRVLMSGEFGAGGRVEYEYLAITEEDGCGQRTATVIFDLDALDAAYAELDRRYAEGEGAPYADLLAHMDAIRSAAGAPDPDVLARILPDDFTSRSHRRFANVGERLTRDQYVASMRAMRELGARGRIRLDHLRVAARAAIADSMWIGTRDGGDFELSNVMVFEHDGRVMHGWEMYDDEQLDRAAARFEELGREPDARFANAASRATERFSAAWRDRDIDAVATLLAPEFRNSDRRPITASELDRPGFLASFGPILERTARMDVASELIATRGDRLALHRIHIDHEQGDIGPSELEFLQIFEVDAARRIAAGVAFDVNDLDSAHAELDARFAAGEGAPHAAFLAHWAAFRAATNARDWETARRLLPDEFSMFSHRRLASTGIRMSRDVFIESLSWGDSSGVRATLRRDHLRLSASAAVEVVTLAGSADGGEFEQEFVLVFGHEGSRLRSCEAFDLDQLDAALAHSEALSRAPAEAGHIENAVTRTEAAFQRAWQARDWDAFAALTPAQFRSIDRRPLMHLEVDRDAMLAGIRPFFEMGVTRSSELLATRGDRLALFRMRLRGSDGLTGPSEVEFVQVIETDADGTRQAGIAFAPDDLDAAYAELDARYHAGEAAAHASVAAGMREFSRAFAARDCEALAARCAPDIAVRDHRRLGWETLHGPAAYMRALRALVELAPDTALRLDHVEMREQGYLVVTVWSGTRDGGAFEEPSLMVAELDAAGRILHFDQYETERLAEARARYESIAARSVDPLRIPPNAATGVIERWSVAAVAHDWATLESLFAAEFAYEDRRRGLRDSGDLAKMLASIRVAVASGARSTHETLATAGDRLALTRNRFSITDGDTLVAEIDILQILELDAAGRAVAAISFDPDDRRAASVEMNDRFVASGEAPAFLAKASAVMRGLIDRDVEPLRASLHPHFYLDDRRRAGMGRIDGAEAFIESFMVLFEQSDLLMEGLYTIAMGDHGILDMAHTFGTLVASGGDFESVYLRLVVVEGDRLAGLELFEPDDLDVARARFEELCAERV